MVAILEVEVLEKGEWRFRRCRAGREVGSGMEWERSLLDDCRVVKLCKSGVLPFKVFGEPGCER